MLQGNILMVVSNGGFKDRDRHIFLRVFTSKKKTGAEECLKHQYMNDSLIEGKAEGKSQ